MTREVTTAAAVERSEEWGRPSDSAGLVFLLALPLVLLATGLMLDTPRELAGGLRRIVTARSLLLSDYLVIGGAGATFVNAGLCGLVATLLLPLSGVSINGPFVAAIYTVVGFAFFGKTIYSIWPILLGVWLYTRVQRIPYRNSLLVALFGTTLAPLVSFFSFAAGLPVGVGIAAGWAVGMLAGFVLPPLASHMLRFHDGYNIYNIGFTGGIIGSFFVAVFRSLRLDVAPTPLVAGASLLWLSAYFLLGSLALVLWGLWLSRAAWGELGRGLLRIHGASGRLVSDFLVIGNYPASLVNMGVLGLLSIGFVHAMGSSLNGPAVGGLMTVVGFAAFGKHARNCLPVFAGVVLGSWVKAWEASSTAVVIAGLFGTTLAPIAGQYGVLAGVLAGFFHLSIVMNVGVLHGGINLYNNGFAGGFVAAFLAPLFNAFRRQEVGS